MQFAAFYSWQSDLPNNTNRGFIEGCLAKAAKRLAEVGREIGVEVAIERDTLDTPGTPDIAATIFEKIRSSSAFIADVTVINPTAESRRVCNPNVALELGYAASSITWERVICVFNLAYGRMPEDLPFDLRGRRVISYDLSPELAVQASAGDADAVAVKRAAADRLTKGLATALLDILEGHGTNAGRSVGPSLRPELYLVSLTDEWEWETVNGLELKEMPLDRDLLLREAEAFRERELAETAVICARFPQRREIFDSQFAAYIERLQSEEGLAEECAADPRGWATAVQLRVGIANVGTKPASGWRVEFSFPTAVVAFEGKPMSRRPHISRDIPKPRTPAELAMEVSYGGVGMRGAWIRSPVAPEPIKDADWFESADRREDNVFGVRGGIFVHTQRRFGSPIWVVAKPGAVATEPIQAEFFCIEMPRPRVVSIPVSLTVDPAT